jgi:tetratricopeptide (TPR) repeat protein
MTSDTLLIEACRFYDRHGSANEQLKAHYLLGCVYRDLGEAPHAVECYQDAIDRADTTSADCDYQLLSRVHGQISNLFNMEHLYRNAIQECNYAISCAKKADDTLAATVFLGQTAGMYYALGNLDSTLIVCKQTRETLCDMGFTKKGNTFLTAPIYILLSRQEFTKAKELLDIYEHQSELADFNSIHNPSFHILYYYKGLYYQGIEMKDSSLYYFRKLAGEETTLNNLGLAYKGLYTMYKASHRDSLTKYADLYVSCLDSIVNNLEQSKLQSVQSLYDYNRHRKIADTKTREAEKFRMQLYISLFLLFIGAMIFWLIIFIIRNRNQRRIQLLTSQYALEILEYQRLKAEMNEMERLQATTSEKYESVKKEFELAKHKLSLMQDEKKSPEEWDLEDALLTSPIVRKFHRMASCASIVSDDDWSMLRETASNYLPNFMRTINSLPYLIDRRETDLCILIRLRFIPSEICSIMNLKSNNLSNIRKRLLKRMFDIDGSASDFDEKLLTIHR